MIAKSLLTEPQVLMLDEPTRGIDVGAKAEIFEIMNQLAEKGLAILFVSSELPEMFGIPDRVIVLSKGRVTGEFLHDQLTEEALVLAAGARQQTEHQLSAHTTELSRKAIARCLPLSIPRLNQSCASRPAYLWACCYFGSEL